MIRYTSYQQLSIEEFKSPFEKEMDANNRWVILSNSLPWDELANIYHKAMSPVKGAPAKDSRIVIGALIVKHKLGISGEETIQLIRENPYIQYFLGIKEFTNNPVFDSALFSSVLKRLGIDNFNSMQKEILEKAFNIRLKNKKNESDHISNYSANLKLLSEARIMSEEIIDALCFEVNHSSKPRTYSLRAFNEYAKATDGTKYTKKENKKAIGRQISFLKRNIKSIYKLLDIYNELINKDKITLFKGFIALPINNSELKHFWVIQQVLEQQQKMYKMNKSICPDRIIDIDQPHLRPVLNTKARFKSLKNRIYLLQQIF
jgi:IS5 family transposase